MLLYADDLESLFLACLGAKTRFRVEWPQKRTDWSGSASESTGEERSPTLRAGARRPGLCFHGARLGTTLSRTATRLVLSGSREGGLLDATDHAKRAVLADRLQSGGRLQRPAPLLEGSAPLSFFTDAKAKDGRAWIGGFLELVDGCHGPWFSLEVKPTWAPWAFAKRDPNKVIA